MKCPDCQSEISEQKNYLTDEEWTVILSCQSCSFEIETESNLVSQDRQERMEKETSVSI
jgi:hypothetical protein